MDPSGNQVSYIDEYGTPIPGYGTSGYVSHHHTGEFDEHRTGGQQHHAGGGQNLHGDGVTPGVLRRSGSSSSSSSSSEDDGLGGRRKKNKGIKEKIKEKLPGGYKNDQNPQQHYGHGVAAGKPTHEKKGIMEKIKKKLPGSHSH